MANVNRLVWANGFTNDKRAYSNKEPYKKVCAKCKKKIWLTPTKSGWKALEVSGEPHDCKPKPKKKKGKSIAKRRCKFCDKDIVFRRIGGKWIPHDYEGGRHRCDEKDKAKVDAILLRDSPL